MFSGAIQAYVDPNATVTYHASKAGFSTQRAFVRAVNRVTPVIAKDALKEIAHKGNGVYQDYNKGVSYINQTVRSSLNSFFDTVDDYYNRPIYNDISLNTTITKIVTTEIFGISIQKAYDYVTRKITDFINDQKEFWGKQYESLSAQFKDKFAAHLENVYSYLPRIPRDNKLLYEIYSSVENGDVALINTAIIEHKQTFPEIDCTFAQFEPSNKTITCFSIYDVYKMDKRKPLSSVGPMVSQYYPTPFVISYVMNTTLSSLVIQDEIGMYYVNLENGSGRYITYEFLFSDQASHLYLPIWKQLTIVLDHNFTFIFWKIF